MVVLAEDADKQRVGCLTPPLSVSAPEASLQDTRDSPHVAPVAAAQAVGSSPSCVVSTFSVSLLRRLLSKEQERKALLNKRRVLVESIGVGGASSLQGDEWGPSLSASDWGPVTTPTEPRPIYTNPSVQALVSDEVEDRQRQSALMQERLATMAAHRRAEAEAPDSHTVQVSPIGGVPLPISADELARRTLPEYSDVLTFARSSDNGSMFQVTEDTVLPDGYSVTTMSRREAVVRGLVDAPDVGMAYNPADAVAELLSRLPGVKKLRAWKQEEQQRNMSRAETLLDNDMITRFMMTYFQQYNRFPERENLLWILAKFPQCLPWFQGAFPRQQFTQSDINSAVNEGVQSIRKEDDFNFLLGSALAFSKEVSDIDSDLRDLEPGAEETEKLEGILLFYKEMFASANQKWKAYIEAMQAHPSLKQSLNKLLSSMKEAEEIDKRLSEAFDRLDRPFTVKQTLAKVVHRAGETPGPAGIKNPHIEEVNKLADAYAAALPNERIGIKEKYNAAYKKFESWYKEQDDARLQACANMATARMVVNNNNKECVKLVAEKEEREARLAAIDAELKAEEETEEQEETREEFLLRELQDVNKSLTLATFDAQEGVRSRDSDDLQLEEKKADLEKKKADLEAAFERLGELKRERTAIAVRLGEIEQQIRMAQFATQQAELRSKQDRAFINRHSDNRRQTEELQRSNRKRTASQATLQTDRDCLERLERHVTNIENNKERWEQAEQQATKKIEESRKRLEALRKSANERDASADRSIGSLKISGKTAAIKAWQAYKQTAPSAENADATIQEFDRQLAELKDQIDDRHARYKVVNKRLKAAQALLTPDVRSLWEEYNRVQSTSALAPFIGFSDPDGRVAAARQELESQLLDKSGGKLTSFVQVNDLDTQRKNDAAEIEQIVQESTNLNNEKKRKESDRQQLWNKYRSSALELYEQISSEASVSGDSSSESDLEAIVQAIDQRRSAIALNAQVQYAEESHTLNYVNLKNAAAHRGSTDPVIRNRGECRDQKTKMRENIRANLKTLTNPNELKEDLWQRVLAALADNDESKEKERKHWERLWEAKVIASQANTSAAKRVYEDLSASSVKNYYQTMVKRTDDTPTSPELEYTEADQIRDLDIMRHRQYDIYVKEMQSFATAGSTRALHFCKLVALYAKAFMDEGNGGNGSIVVVNDGSTQSSDSANLDPLRDEFTINWAQVDAFVPAGGAARLGEQLKYVLAQWAGLPLERRAGSLPDEEEIDMILSSGLVADGADGSQPVKDPITKELMVVTTEDASFSSGSNAPEAMSSGDGHSYPLGEKKRTPVSWLWILRDAQEAHVPVDDQLFVVRQLPDKALYALHLTHDETLAEFAAYGGVTERARYESQVKWWPPKGGDRYADIKADELTAAMWQAVLQSRQEWSTLKTVYTKFQEELSQKQTQLRSLYSPPPTTETTAATGNNPPSVTGMSAMSAKEYSKVFGVDTSSINKEEKAKRIENLMANPKVLSKVAAVQQSIAALQKALFKIKFRVLGTHGLPTSRIGLDLMLPSKVDDLLNRHSEVETIATTGKLGGSGVEGEESSGLSDTTWIDNPTAFAKVATFFNSFFDAYYPWQRPVDVDTPDMEYMKTCIAWMLKLKEHRYTYVEVSLAYSAGRQGDVLCWFVNPTSHMGMFYLGPSIDTEQQLRYLENEANQHKKSLYYNTWKTTRPGRLHNFEGQHTEAMSVVEDREAFVDDTAKVFRAIASSMHAAGKVMTQGKVKQLRSAGDQLDAERKLRASWKKTTTASELKSLGVLNEAQRRDVELRTLRDQANSVALGAQGMSVHELENAVDPIVDVMIPRLGMQPERIQFRIQEFGEIDPTDLNAVLIAMGEKYSGTFATAIKTVEGGRRVGTIIRMGQPKDEDIDESTVCKITNDDSGFYYREFEKWLESTDEFQRLLGKNYDESSSESGSESGSEGGGENDSDENAESVSDEMSVDGEDDGEDDSAYHEDELENSSDEEDDAGGAMVSAAMLEDTAGPALLAEADMYIKAAQQRPALAVQAAKLRAVLSMYDPGLLRPPIDRAGALIRPVPLPEIEIEI